MKQEVVSDMISYFFCSSTQEFKLRDQNKSIFSLSLPHLSCSVTQQPPCYPLLLKSTPKKTDKQLLIRLKKLTLSNMGSHLSVVSEWPGSDRVGGSIQSGSKTSAALILHKGRGPWTLFNVPCCHLAWEICQMCFPGAFQKHSCHHPFPHTSGIENTLTYKRLECMFLKSCHHLI